MTIGGGVELLRLARAGDADGIRALLDGGEASVGASFQDEGSGRSALMEAAGAGSVECVTVLLERGAPWNAIDRTGKCAGEYAHERGCQACVDALVEAGVRAQLLYGVLDGDLGPPSTYLQSNVHFDGAENLVDATGDAVMMKWETPLMEAHADVLCGRFPHEWISPKARASLAVLNVGHGTGIVDGFIQDRGDAVRTHTILEAHPQVLDRMRRAGWFDKSVVVGERWQDALRQENGADAEGPPALGPFDAIFFDTYAESYADMKAFFETLPTILRKPDGIFSFFNGMCPFNVFFHGVACQLVLVELERLGLEVDYVPLKVDELPESTWRGVKRRYWIFDTYHLPIVRWKKIAASSSSP